MKDNTLTLASLFDGSGGFPLGGLLAGITPVWASEIEPFPIRVTTKRLPFMKHYGDVSKINGAEVEPVDIITFGSPCTDMSVAGKRAGLDGTQSVLFYEAIRIIKEMRCATNGKYPRYAVWENVPGAFSSNKGEDFRAVLEAFIGVIEPNAQVPMPEKGRWAYADLIMGDGWSIAYRTYDAQYWGVPQRRRRIYLVADFRGECAGKISFKREGVRGYFAEDRTPWQGASGDVENGIGTDDSKGACIGFHLTQDVITSEKISPCLSSGNPVTGQASIGVAYGFPLGFRPENVRMYEETATTLCNGTRAGFCNGVVVGVDLYNQTTTGMVSKTLNSVRSDADHTPVVCIQDSTENKKQNGRGKLRQANAQHHAG